MKKHYESPSVEILWFDAGEVIATSNAANITGTEDPHAFPVK